MLLVGTFLSSKRAVLLVLYIHEGQSKRQHVPSFLKKGGTKATDDDDVGTGVWAHALCVFADQRILVSNTSNMEPCGDLQRPQSVQLKCPGLKFEDELILLCYITGEKQTVFLSGSAMPHKDSNTQVSARFHCPSKVEIRLSGYSRMVWYAKLHAGWPFGRRFSKKVEMNVWLCPAILLLSDTHFSTLSSPTKDDPLLSFLPRLPF